MIGAQAARRVRTQLLTLVAIVFAATALTFAVTEILPGDAAVAILGDTATEAEIKSLRAELGLERPLVVRYVDWVGNALTGDLGRSYRTRESIATMIAQRLPVTIELIIITQIIALGLAVPAGIIAAYRNRSAVDHALGGVSIGLLSTPAFVIGIGLIYTLSVALGWFPASGYVRPSDSILGNLHGMILPALTLALAEFPVYMRLLRADMIATLQQDFILVARAKGPRRARHSRRPRAAPLLAVAGYRDRHQPRPPGRRRGDHRDAVRHSRHRPDAGQRRVPARPLRHSGRGADRRHRLRADQPRR